MLVGLCFFTLYLSGVVDIKLPALNFYKPSPDMTVTKLQTLCGLEKYEAVAIHSLKYENINQEYLRITSDDILKRDQTKPINYLELAKSLCNTFETSRKVEKKKVSDLEWEYRYYAGILFDSSQVYRIVFFEDDWRFVMGK